MSLELLEPVLAAAIARPPKWEWPVALVSVVRELPDASCMAVTQTPAMMAPEESTTEP